MAQTASGALIGNVDPLLDGAQRRLLLVASTGGHLAQLVRISERWNLREDSVWFTFDAPQSRSLLVGKNVHYVPYVRSRGYGGIARTLPHALKLLRRSRFDAVVSTGAAVALGVFPIAKALGVPTFYIESVSRVSGPSLTGRILDRARIADNLRTQHHAWSSSRWQNYPSVMSQFRSVDRSPRTLGGKPNIFVTLGTIRPYRFDSAVDAVLATGLAGPDTTWQLGVTNRTLLPGDVHEQLPHAEMLRVARAADVVVTHAGVGTILTLLENGIHPVVIPRQKKRGEHVDDHQAQIAELVARLGVATVSNSESLTAEHLRDASRRAIVSASELPLAADSSAA